jgi:hypothetical protein
VRNRPKRKSASGIGGGWCGCRVIVRYAEDHSLLLFQSGRQHAWGRVAVASLLAIFSTTTSSSHLRLPGQAVVSRLHAGMTSGLRTRSTRSASSPVLHTLAAMPGHVADASGGMGGRPPWTGCGR